MTNIVTEKETECLSHAITWDQRLHQVLDIYSGINDISPPLIPALKNGLKQWSAILPQSFQDQNGCYQPVNTWGLGAEKTEVYALVDWLIIERKRDLSDSLRKKFETLYETSQALDESFPALGSQDQSAEKRLVKMCRRQADQLINFLERLVPVIFRVSQKKSSEKSDTASGEILSIHHQKRIRRASDIERVQKELTEHIKSAQNLAWSLIHTGKSPILLPRPQKKDLAKQAGVSPCCVTRCFKDPHAKELRRLWGICDDLEQTLHFKQR